MTRAPRTPPVSFDSVDAAIEGVRGSGLRLSTARRLVLEALYSSEGPVSAPALAERLRVDPASIYRNLELLERHGLVHHVHLGHGPGLWVRAGWHEHEYLHCERCGRVTEVRTEDLDPIREQIRERFGYRTRFTHFALVGVCEACASAIPNDRP